MNKVLLSGKLMFDCKVGKTAGGNDYCSNMLIVKNAYKSRDTGKYDTSVFRIMVFGNSATYLGKYCKKGDQVELVGHLNQEGKKNADGKWENEKISVFVEGVSKVFDDRPKEPGESLYETPTFEERVPNYGDNAGFKTVGDVLPQGDGVSSDDPDDDLPF